MNDLIKDMNDLPALLTPKNLQSLGFSKVTAYRLTKTEGFPTLKVGRKIIVPKADFIEWLGKNFDREVK